MIRHQFRQVELQLEQWVELAATVLAHAAGNVSLVTAPRTATTRLRHLELIELQPRLGMVILVTLGESWEDVYRRKRHAFALGVMIVTLSLVAIGGAVGFMHRDFSLQWRIPEDRYPVEALHLLKEERGNLAVFFNWGEYVLYHLHPRILVSIDGRYETVYPEEVVRANRELNQGVPGSEAFLDTYHADFALYPVVRVRSRLADASTMPNLVRWVEALGRRAGVARGMAATERSP